MLPNPFKPHHLLTLLLTTFLTTAHSQTFNWVKTFGAELQDQGLFIALDASGNIFTAGSFEGTVDFDPGAGVSNLTSNGYRDIFIQKLDAQGNFVWAKSFGGTYEDYLMGMTLDAQGNICTTGNYYYTVDFDPGAGVSNLTVAGASDAFVHKLDAEGNFIWARSIGGLSYEYGDMIAADALGNVYVSGSFEGTVDFDPGAASQELTAIEVLDIFVEKLDADGNFQWVKTFGGNYYDQAFALTVDASGNVYTGGYFYGELDFDPGEGEALIGAEGATNLFVSKLDSDGNYKWARAFFGTDAARITAITVDAAENVYTTGGFMGTGDFDPADASQLLTSAGDNDVFVQKMDIDGNFVWATAFGGSQDDFGNGIALDALGNVYTTGSFQGSVPFAPEVGIADLESEGMDDIYVHRMDVDGNLVWAKSVGGTALDYGQTLVVDPTGDVLVTGLFSASVNFNLEDETDIVTSAGDLDAFILKISQPVMAVTDARSDIRVTAYPNPSSGTVHLTSGTILTNVELTLSDMLGRVILNKSYGTLSDATLDFAGAGGIYNLSIKSNGNQQTVRLVKR